MEREPEAPEYVGHRPRGLKQPGEPTLTGRLEHELTHLLFKPWCEVCARQEQAGQEPQTFPEAACAADGR